MRLLQQGLGLVLVTAGLTALPALSATAAPAAPAAADPLLQQMRSEASGSVALKKEPATDRVGFVRATGATGARRSAKGTADLMPSVQGDSLPAAIRKATAYVDKFGPAFGAPAEQLTRTEATSSRYGYTVTFTQRYKGLPVFGSMLKANVDRAGDLTSVNGYAAPGLDLDPTPRMSPAQASKQAVAMVRADPTGARTEADIDTSGLKAVSNDLMVYRTGAIRHVAGAALLAYVVEVSNRRNIRDRVFLDANTGKLVNRYSMVDNVTFGPDRELYEADADRNLRLVWREGDPLPGGLTEDEANMVQSTGDSYWLYANTFDRDSYDGAGARMVTINNDPLIACPNANWNGETTNYCDGVSSDDVVSHEWGHAYTEYTSGLVYQAQSGAINESYSDVWGETIDLINGRDDADEGDLSANRPVGQCSAHSPDLPLLTINSPTGIAKKCLTGGLLGPGLSAPITGDVVAPTDTAEQDGTTTDGCSDYDDPAAAAGKIVLVDRGLCPFVQKAEVARDAGAAAVVIGNNEDAPVGFGSDDATLPVTVSIGLADRELIRAALTRGETVNVTIEDSSGAGVDSYRWLIGEKSEAFGAAIRDMWNPPCHGDPGKVTDAEYKCSTDDSGGVHSNSGVPNHGYALLADGGTYNGVRVEGVGLDKAANLFWRTQLDYLTPFSNFADLADGLDAACAALAGQPINALSTVADTPGAAADPITTTDCEQVTAMEQAVELRTEPAQCDFKPLLAKHPPSLCGNRFRTRTVWREGFEDGLRGWRQNQEVVFEGGNGFPWRSESDVPGGHRSTVAFGAAPNEGRCSGGAGDVSSVDSIASRRIRLPRGHVRRLSFQHYVATEFGYDGGNVKMSVNGGEFAVIPSSAYVFNSPNARLYSAEEGNTNPLAGQDAFSGTDGGSALGSWGTSIVDLREAGARAGDRVRFRFDIGRDGCGGIDGWYVDNIRVTVCVRKHGVYSQVAEESRATRNS